MVEKTGPPGSVALSECAAYAVATCFTDAHLGAGAAQQGPLHPGVGAHRSQLGGDGGQHPAPARRAELGQRAGQGRPAEDQLGAEDQHHDGGHHRAAAPPGRLRGRGRQGVLVHGHRFHVSTSAGSEGRIGGEIPVSLLGELEGGPAPANSPRSGPRPTPWRVGAPSAQQIATIPTSPPHRGELKRPANRHDCGRATYRGEFGRPRVSPLPGRGSPRPVTMSAGLAAGGASGGMGCCRARRKVRRSLGADLGRDLTQWRDLSARNYPRSVGHLRVPTPGRRRSPDQPAQTPTGRSWHRHHRIRWSHHQDPGPSGVTCRSWNDHHPNRWENRQDPRSSPTTCRSWNDDHPNRWGNRQDPRSSPTTCRSWNDDHPNRWGSHQDPRSSPTTCRSWNDHDPNRWGKPPRSETAPPPVDLGTTTTRIGGETTKIRDRAPPPADLGTTTTRIGGRTAKIRDRAPPPADLGTTTTRIGGGNRQDPRPPHHLSILERRPPESVGEPPRSEIEPHHLPILERPPPESVGKPPRSETAPPPVDLGTTTTRIGGEATKIRDRPTTGRSWNDDHPNRWGNRQDPRPPHHRPILERRPPESVGKPPRSETAPPPADLGTTTTRIGGETTKIRDRARPPADLGTTTTRNGGETTKIQDQARPPADVGTPTTATGSQETKIEDGSPRLGDLGTSTPQPPRVEPDEPLLGAGPWSVPARWSGCGLCRSAGRG